MSAVLRVWWMFFTAVPLQRWLGAFGCLLLLLGLAGALLTERPSTATAAFGLGFVGFGIFALFPAVVMTGALLRSLSAPLSHQLYPHLRIRLLLAVIMLIASVTGLIVAFVATHAAAFPAVTSAGTAVAVIGVSTATIVAIFIVSGHWRMSWLVFGLLVAGTFWLKGGGPELIRAAGFSVTAAFGALTAAVWVGFVAGYLRVARIKPTSLPPPGHVLPEEKSDMRRPLSRAAAARSLLGGTLPRPLPRAVLAAIGFGAALMLLLTLMRFLPGSRTPTPPLLTFIWPMAAMFGVGPFAERAIRQSRLLWLHTGGGRRETLRVTEAFLGRFYLVAAVVIVTAAALAPVFWPTTLREIVLLLAASLSSALCAAYVVLFARGSALISVVGFLTLLAAQVTLIGLPRPTASVLGVATLTALQLGAAAALRFAAIRRWRKVDWLTVRPARTQRLM
jgi:hypothetical protein